MSVTSDPEDSCASYSPSLVKLVTSFVKSNTEEAEIRAHKSLAILQAKDGQLQQLQDRICFLEEGLVPKLQLPRSASVNAVDSVVTRDETVGLLLLPQHFFPSSSEDEDLNSIVNGREQIVSECRYRWQYIVDQLELYNKQLEADLKQESKLRSTDKQKYCTVLAGVTEALYSVNKAIGEVRLKEGAGGDNANWNKQNRGQNLEGIHSISNKKCRPVPIDQVEHEDKLEPTFKQSNQNLDMQSFNKEQIIDRLSEGQDTIVKLQKHVQVAEKRYKKEWSMRKSLEEILAKHNSASVSEGTVLSSFRLRKRKSYCSVKRKTERKIKLHKLQQKCNQLYSELEKKKASCNKLEAETVNMSKKCEVLQSSEDKYTSEIEKKDGVIRDLKEKLIRTPTSELLKGRLDAAAQVMSKQHKQIKQTEQECLESRKALDNLKRRLSRAEALNSKRESLVETNRKQQSDIETKLIAEQQRNKSLNCEILKLKDLNSMFHTQITNLKQQQDDLMRKKDESENNLVQLKSIMEYKLNTLSETLQKKISVSEESQTMLQDKLTRLRTQFVSQMQEASCKIASADAKIRELFGGIELFLKMLLASQPPLSTLSSPQVEEAVQEVCSILNLSPAQMQNIVCSARTPDYEKINWLQECYKLIYLEEFSEKLGHLLFDAVNHIKK